MMRHVILAAVAGLLAVCNAADDGDGNRAAEAAANQSSADRTTADGDAPAAGNGVATASASSDQLARADARARIVAGCTAAVRTGATRAGNRAVANANLAPLCGCAADKVLAGRSLAEAARGLPPAEEQAVLRACLKEHPVPAS